MRELVALSSLLHDVFNLLHRGSDGRAPDGADALGLIDAQDAAGEVLDLTNLGPTFTDDAPSLPLALHLDRLDGVFAVVFTAAPAAAAFVPLGLLRRLALSLGGGLIRVEVVLLLLLLLLLLRGLGLLVGARIVVRASLLPHPVARWM